MHVCNAFVGIRWSKCEESENNQWTDNSERTEVSNFISLNDLPYGGPDLDNQVGKSVQSRFKWEIRQLSATLNASH